MTPPSALVWRGLAADLAHAEGLQEALDVVVAEAARGLRTRTCIVQPAGSASKILAQARGGLDLSLSDLPEALANISIGSGVGLLDLRALGRGRWTSVGLAGTGDSPLVLLVSGDHEPLAAPLSELAIWLPLALAGAAERDRRRGVERLVVDLHAMARRLGGLGGLEAVARHVVAAAARLIPADRIALAVYLADENRLAILATHGYSASDVQHVRIEPGAGVIGHVFASGRPLLVRDVRQVGSLDARRPYRTSSFAAVPIAGRANVLGVLTATDKRDGSAFDHQDQLRLRVVAGVAAVGLIAARFDEEAARLAHAATFDALTGLYNRHGFEVRLHQEMERARRIGASLALMMADIDDFKMVNDSLGHLAGDGVLQAVGAALRSAIRVFDVCGRYGGDEFAILMPDADLASATHSAERIRERVAVAYDGAGIRRRPTISVGVAVLQPNETSADLLRRADTCLYDAKASGKNRVRAAVPREPRRLSAASPQPSSAAWPSPLDE